MISEIDWDKAIAAIGGAERIAVCCHISPDGDALGSMLGLGGFLIRGGKTVWMSWGSANPSIPPQYSFLPGVDKIVDHSSVPDDLDLLIAIDCGDRQRLELLESKFKSARATINIDHHISNDLFGDINIVDTARASSSELAYELVKRMSGTPTHDEAVCIYTGIVTDTGRFQYSNTTPATLRTAAELREIVVDHDMISENVYESSSFNYLHVLGVVLSRAELESGLVYSWVMQTDLHGLSLDETEHFIDVLRAVRESKVAALLKEQSDGTFKVSLRSRADVDVSAIAQHFGGGGHSRAAGYSASGSAEEIVKAIKAQLVG